MNISINNGREIFSVAIGYNCYLTQYQGVWQTCLTSTDWGPGQKNHVSGQSNNPYFITLYNYLLMDFLFGTLVNSSDCIKVQFFSSDHYICI